jgi:hypothetical protein
MKMGAIVKKLSRFLEYYGLGLSWLACWWWMWQDHVEDPGFRGDYGDNLPWSYQGNVIEGFVELAVLYLLLNPWDSRRVLERIFITFLLCFGWTFFSLIISMHAGQITFIRLRWLVAVNVVLIVGFLIKFIGFFTSQRRP